MGVERWSCRGCRYRCSCAPRQGPDWMATGGRRTIYFSLETGDVVTDRFRVARLSEGPRIAWLAVHPLERRAMTNDHHYSVACIMVSGQMSGSHHITSRASLVDGGLCDTTTALPVKRHFFLMVIWHGRFQRQLKSNQGGFRHERDSEVTTILAGGTFGVSCCCGAARLAPGLYV